LKFSTEGEYTLSRIEIKVEATANTAKLKDDTTALNSVDAVIKKLELDGKTADIEGNTELTDVTSTNSGTGMIMYYYFDDISLKNETKELDLTFDVVDNAKLNTAGLKFTAKVIAIVDEEEDKDYPLSAVDPLKDVEDILSSNSFDKTITIESASFSLSNTEVNSRDLVLGNNIETIIYKGKISVGDADDVTLKDIEFEYGYGNHFSDSTVDLKDIIDSVTINIGGKVSY
jgi:hypothetical protein